MVSNALSFLEFLYHGWYSACQGVQFGGRNAFGDRSTGGRVQKNEAAGLLFRAAKIEHWFARLLEPSVPSSTATCCAAFQEPVSLATGFMRFRPPFGDESPARSAVGPGYGSTQTPALQTP